MVNIQKPLPNRGYILLEAFFALFIVGGTILVLINQSAFLLKYEDKVMKRLNLYRILYEESTLYCRFNETIPPLKQNKYRYSFHVENGVVISVEIHEEKESICIERKN